MKHLLYLPVLAFALTACAEREVEEPIDDPLLNEPMATEPMTTDPMATDTAAVGQDVTVEGTISALEGGVTSLAPSTALENIRAWEARLASVDGSEEVREGLAELRAALGETPLNGARIGDILEDLGEDTSALGAGNANVERLGRLLTQAGQQLD